jgi:hypothetical protein
LRDENLAPDQWSDTQGPEGIQHPYYTIIRFREKENKEV